MGTIDETTLTTVDEAATETMVPGPVPPPLSKGPLFELPLLKGEKLPIKGIVFEVLGATKEGNVIMKPVDITNGARKRMGMKR